MAGNILVRLWLEDMQGIDPWIQWRNHLMPLKRHIFRFCQQLLKAREENQSVWIWTYSSGIFTCWGLQKALAPLPFIFNHEVLIQKNPLCERLWVGCIDWGQRLHPPLTADFWLQKLKRAASCQANSSLSKRPFTIGCHLVWTCDLVRVTPAGTEMNFSEWGWGRPLDYIVNIIQGSA